ncbi:MAG: acyltransferase [Endozoicomonadaceae bacterium]|nr:acyltransferase [Endozoicomonadaceae bacterium]
MFFKKFSLLYVWLIRLVTSPFPDVPFVMRIRGFLYSAVMKECGANFQVSSLALLKSITNFRVGNDVYLAPFVVVNAIADVHLESEVMIAFGVVINSGNHSKIDNSYRFGKSICAPIKVGFGAWVGANSTLIGGSSLPAGSVLGANSLLNKKYDSGELFGGVPSKLIK